MRIQIQFDDLGDAAVVVGDYLAEFWPHCDPVVTAAPGLSVVLTIPAPLADATLETWHQRLLATTSPLDVALEIVSDTLTDLGLRPVDVLAIHLTKA